jgi:hypothetical protein
VEFNDSFFEPYNTKNVIRYRDVFALDEFRKRLANILRADTVDITILLDIDEECNTILLARFSSSKREVEELKCLPCGNPEEHIFIGKTRSICGFCGSARIQT